VYKYFMLRKTDIHFNMGPIIDQVKKLGYDDKRIRLNFSKEGLLSGPYDTLPEFKNTPLGNVLDSLGPIGEARLLTLDSGETYTAHTYPDDRFQLSIISNPYCFMANLEDGTLHNIEVDGYIHEMDTGIIHSALNLGGTIRTHLNVRKLLPKIQKPYYNLKFETNGDADWKQQLYLESMGFVNRMIKEGKITGFEKVNELEVLISVTDDHKALDHIISTAESKGFQTKISLVIN
jgi:hypothetical protein